MRRIAVSDYPERYLTRITGTMQDIWSGSALHILVGGSIALGDYSENRSDIDIVIVHVTRPTTPELRSLARQLDHRVLPCPAKGLDLVGFHMHDVQRTPPHPRALYGYVTGKSWMTELSGEETSAELLIDLSVTRNHGWQLVGSPPSELIGDVPRGALTPVISHVVPWHRDRVHDPFHDPSGASAVLNACRAWCFIVTGEMLSKSKAGDWANRQVPSHLVREALDQRQRSRAGRLNKQQVEVFLDDVARAIASAPAE